MPAQNVSVSATFEPDKWPKEVVMDTQKAVINFKSDQADTEGKVTSDADFKAGYVKVSDGNFAANNKTYDEQSTGGIISFNASDYIGRIRKAELKVTNGTASGTNTNLRCYKIGNYIDFSSTINATTIGNLTNGTVDSSHPVQGSNFASSGKSNGSVNITDIVRADEDGQITIGVGTTSGRLVTAEKWEIVLTVEKEAIQKTSATVTTVYEDKEGEIEGQYTAFGSPKTYNDLYVGDQFKPEYETEIDQPKGTPKAKLTYKSGGDEITLSETNNIYIVYDKADYTEVTFTVTVDEAPTQSVEFKLTGTDATNYDETLTSGESGIVTADLLADTYTATVEEGKYKGFSQSITVPTANTLTVALETNTQTLGTITIKDTNLNKNINVTTNEAGRTVGKLATEQKDTKGVDMSEPEQITWKVQKSGVDSTDVTVDEDGTVKIKSSAAAGEYTITATGAVTSTVSSDPYTLTLKENGTETVAMATGVDKFSITPPATLAKFSDESQLDVIKFGAANGKAELKLDGDLAVTPDDGDG